MTTEPRRPWITIAVVTASAVALALPPLSLALEYDRAAVLGGEVWRVLTSQLTHWTPRMALFDLAVLALAAGWLELRSRRQAAIVLAAGAAAVAIVLLASPGIERYRGSSGLAVACVAALAAGAVRTGPRAVRAAGVAVLVLLAAKIAVEATFGAAVFAGALPEGVRVLPAVHAAAAVAGIAVALISRTPAPPAARA